MSPGFLRKRNLRWKSPAEELVWEWHLIMYRQLWVSIGSFCSINRDWTYQSKRHVTYLWLEQSPIQKRRERSEETVWENRDKGTVRTLGCHALSSWSSHVPLYSSLCFLTCRVKILSGLPTFHPPVHCTKMCHPFLCAGHWAKCHDTVMSRNTHGSCLHEIVKLGGIDRY